MAPGGAFSAIPAEVQAHPKRVSPTQTKPKIPTLQ